MTPAACKGDNNNMDMGDLFTAGSDIMSQVSQAVETGDYSGLSSSIRERVNQVTDELREQAKAPVAGGAYSSPYAEKQKAAGTQRKPAEKKNYFLRRFPSRNLGTGRIAVGILLGFTPALCTVALLLNCVRDLFAADFGSLGPEAVSLLIMGAITYGFYALIRSGRKKKALVKRFYLYGNIVGDDREYIAISELSDKSGVSENQIREDIQALRADNILPYAVLDRSGTTLILSDRMYKEYVNAENSRKMREEEDRVNRLRQEAQNSGTGETWEQASGKVAAQDAKAKAQAARAEAEKKAEESGRFSGASKDTDGQTPASAMIAEGNAYIAEIRAINDRIPDTEEMSDKLYRLEEITKRIFEQVQKDPSKEKDLRKLMNYYLPTTTKLLNAYADLNDQPEAGENIRETKRQIEGSMDVINEAFEKLLDDLFQEQAWDLSSDLNVMKTMMAQDGLTENAT